MAFFGNFEPFLPFFDRKTAVVVKGRPFLSYHSFCSSKWALESTQWFIHWFSWPKNGQNCPQNDKKWSHNCQYPFMWGSKRLFASSKLFHFPEMNSTEDFWGLMLVFRSLKGLSATKLAKIGRKRQKCPTKLSSYPVGGSSGYYTGHQALCVH